MDTGLLIIRLAIGLYLTGHGLQKLFGWFGGHGLAGTGGFFESLGYRPGRRNAALAGLAETGGGLLLALGLLTPLGAAIAVGVMVNAMGAVHWRNGLWVTDGGIEYPFVVAAVAAGVAFTGAGAFSLDNALDLQLGGGGWGIAAVAVGLASGFALLRSRQIEPAAPEVRGPAEVSEGAASRRA